jgi:hypothetical protein
MISCVISAWRSRFICRVRSLMMSPALSDAQRAVDRDLDVGRDEALEDGLGIRLVLHEGVLVAVVGLAVPLVLLALLEDARVLHGQQRLARDLLGERGDVAVVDDVHAVDLTVHVGGHEVRGDPPGVRVGGALREAGVLPHDLLAAEGERGDAAAPRRVIRRIAPA